MSVDRPDFAEESWKQVRKFFRSNSAMLTLIDLITAEGRNHVLYASTSLHQLDVSPKHRWDAKVENFSISAVESGCGCLYRDHTGKELETVSGSATDLATPIREYAQRLVSNYELQD
ncbi:hypothetical protein MLD52_22780 [Puniceicoccaceae bacterium K14]|nr:hypothetical protein [Puniceicoccaceae bacterium K14]